MKPNKRLAAVVAGALAASGAVAIATAAPAQASAGTINYGCMITNNAVATTPTLYTNVQGSITVTPSSVSVGSPQTIGLTVGAAGPSSYTNGPTPVAAGAYQPIANISIDGAAPQNVISPTVSAADPAGFSPVFPGGWTASAVVTQSTGAHTVELEQIIYNSTSSGPAYPGFPAATNVATQAVGFDAICNSGTTQAGITGGSVSPTWTASPAPGLYLNAFAEPNTVIGPNATILTSSGQNAGVQAARFSASYATSLTLSGTVFDPSVAATVQFCDVTGVSCDTITGPGITVNTLATDGSGNLTGGFTVSAGSGGITTGNRAIKVTAGATNALVPVLILASPVVNLSPSSGGPGTVVSVSGSNFNPSQAITIQGRILAVPPFTASADASASGGTASSVGAMSAAPYTVNDPATAAITAGQGIPGPPSPGSPSGFGTFTVNQDQCTADTGNVNTGNCNTKQNVYATVLAGSLAQAAATTAGNPNATTVVFCKTAAPLTNPGGTQPGNTVACGLSSPLAATPMFATLNTVTVTDTRGGNFGWSLTATMPNLSDGSHSIANGNVAISPTCASSNAGSAPGHAAGAAAQTFSGTVSLCVKDTQVAPSPGSQTTGGQWAVGGPLTLTVPAFQAAGQYNSTMTVNLA